VDLAAHPARLHDPPRLRPRRGRDNVPFGSGRLVAPDEARPEVQVSHTAPRPDAGILSKRVLPCSYLGFVLIAYGSGWGRCAELLIGGRLLRAIIRPDPTRRISLDAQVRRSFLHPCNGVAIAIMGVPRGPHALRGGKRYNPARPSGNTAPGRNCKLWPDRLSSFDPAFSFRTDHHPTRRCSRWAVRGHRRAVPPLRPPPTMRVAGALVPAPVAEANLAR
jgi:hypothetical protein